MSGLIVHSVKMYKSHITAWGLRKNNSVHEARAIMSKKRVLDALGLTSVFIVRGELADLEDVQRCYKRAQRSLSMADEEEEGGGGKKNLPDGVSCVVFQDSVTFIKAPDRLRNLESFLHHTAIHVEGCFDQGLWRSSSDDEDLSYYPQIDQNIAKECFSDLRHASACFDARQCQLVSVCPTSSGQFSNNAPNKSPRPHTESAGPA